MSVTKIISLFTQLGTALGCFCLGEDSLQMAKELGMSEGLGANLAKGAFTIGNTLMLDKFKEDGKKFLDGANHDYEKAMRAAYDATFKDLEEELYTKYINEKESGVGILLRLMFDKGNAAHDERQRLVNQFINPLHGKLTEREEIQKMLDKHKFLDTEGYLRETIKEVLPSYTLAEEEATEQFVADAVVVFKRLFRHHFLQQMKHNKNACTVYFCSLMEANLQYGKINEQLIRQVISELGIGKKNIIKGFVLLHDYAEKLDSTIKQEGIETRAAITAQTEPHLYSNDWSDEVSEDTVSEMFNYKFQYTSFVGRNTELSQLLEFAQYDSSNHPFKWWMITGPGGMGKSRLAFEVAKTLRSMGYHAGFYDLSLPAQHNWNQWTASRPTFIIIDYALTDIKKTEELIKALRNREECFKHPVRLLLLERQLSTEWEQSINESSIRRSRYKTGEGNNTYVLKDLKEYLWEIMAQVIHNTAEETVKATLLTQKEELLTQLETIDELHRPLFAFFAAKALALGENIRGWNVNQLLDFHIKRLQQEYWRKIAGYTQYKEKINLLLVINTLLLRLDEYGRDGTLQYLQLNWQDIKNIYPKMANVKEENGVKYYMGLEPDILGEYFIITTLTELANEGRNEKLQADNLVKFAMFGNPVLFFTTLYRIWVDFYWNEDFAVKKYPFEEIIENLIADFAGEDIRAYLAFYFSEKGYYYGKVEQYQYALESYGKSISYEPQNSIWWNNRGISYEKLGKYDDAMQDFNKAIIINPQYTQGYFSRGNINSILENYAEAILDYDKAISLNPTDKIIYNNRGNAKVRLKKCTEAILDYNKVIELDENFSIGYCNRGFAKIEIKQYSDAILDFDKSIYLDPNDFNAYNGRGTAKTKFGNYEDAIIDYDKAISLNKDNPDGYYNRGNAKFNLNRFFEAIEDYDKAIDINKYNGSYWNNKCLALISLANIEQSKERYNEFLNDALNCIYNALRLGSDNVYILAWTYTLLDDKSNAFTHLEQALLKNNVDFASIMIHNIWDKWRNEPEYLTLKEKYESK